MTDNDILNFFCIDSKIISRRVSKHYIIKHNPNLLNVLYNRFKDIKPDTPINEILYRIKHKIEECPKCIVCGKELKFDVHRGYGTYCSMKCYKSTDGTKIWKEKFENTMQERYGVSHPLKSQEIKQKQINNNIKKYGVSNVFQLESVKQQIKETSQKRYGVSHPCKSDEIKQKIIETNYNRYYSGTDEAKKLKEERQKKSKATCLKHYGVEHALCSKELLEKLQQYNIKKYGVKSYLETEDCKNKTKKKLKALNIDSFTQLPEIKEKIKNTCIKKYGAPSIFQADEYKEKVNALRKQKFATALKISSLDISFGVDQHMSVVEYNVLLYLIDIFGKNDIIYNAIIDNRYPYHVDFYIKSLDLFIEINGHWTHNTHPYNPDNLDDVNMLSILKEKAKNSLQYQAAIKIWTEVDPKKQEIANNNNLNYIVTWGKNIKKTLLQIQEYLNNQFNINAPINIKIIYKLL